MFIYNIDYQFVRQIYITYSITLNSGESIFAGTFFSLYVTIISKKVFKGGTSLSKGGTCCNVFLKTLISP